MKKLSETIVRVSGTLNVIIAQLKTLHLPEVDV